MAYRRRRRRRRKFNIDKLKVIIVLVIFAICYYNKYGFSFSSAYETDSTIESSSFVTPVDGTIEVYYLDVGEAESILINGCGFIALVLAQILIKNKKRVYIRNRNQEKLKFALDNFDVSVYNDKVDCIVDFVSNSQSMNFIIDAVNSHGTIIAVGNPSREILIDKHNYSTILRRELSIKGVWNSKRDDWLNVIKMIENRDVDVKKLITHRYEYTDFKKAFEKILNNQTNYNELIIKSMILF